MVDFHIHEIYEYLSKDLFHFWQGTCSNDQRISYVKSTPDELWFERNKSAVSFVPLGIRTLVLFTGFTGHPVNDCMLMSSIAWTTISHDSYEARFILFVLLTRSRTASEVAKIVMANGWNVSHGWINRQL